MDRARVVIAIALLGGVAAALAFALWPRKGGPDDAPPSEEEIEPQSIAAANTEEVADEAVPPPSIAREVDPRTDAPGGSVPAPLAPADVGPLAPEVREHAKGMVIPTTALAIDRRDAKHLREVLLFLKQHRDEGVITDADLGAIEAAIACIEAEPEAREEAADFLRFGGNTALATNLEKVCGLK